MGRSTRQETVGSMLEMLSIRIGIVLAVSSYRYDRPTLQEDPRPGGFLDLFRRGASCGLTAPRGARHRGYCYARDRCEYCGCVQSPRAAGCPFRSYRAAQAVAASRSVENESTAQGTVQ